MSTGLIIAIIAVVVIVLVALVALRPVITRRRRERELAGRRERRAGELRSEAEQREQRAQAAEKRAQLAAAEAERERAAARVHQQDAEMHEQGLRDDQLINEDERDRFAGTSAFSDDGSAFSENGVDREGDFPRRERIIEPQRDGSEPQPGQRTAR